MRAQGAVMNEFKNKITTCPLCQEEAFRVVGKICIYCHRGLWKELEIFLNRQGFDIESSDEDQIVAHFLKSEITFRIWQDRLILRSKKNGWQRLLYIFPTFSTLKRWAEDRYLSLQVEERLLKKRASLS